MVVLRHGTTFFIFLIFICSLILTTNARRKYDRRRDLENPLPITESGWTVPLEGGKTCEDSTRCEWLTKEATWTDVLLTQ